MLDVILIFPLMFKKFYINPFYLQNIYARIEQANFSQQLSIKLFDINTEQYNQKHYDLAIIDTPEGEVESLKNILDIIKANTILLVGDVIKYGKSKELLKYLSDSYSQKIYGCLDDFAIVDFVKSYLNNCKVDDNISGLMFYSQNNFFQNKLNKVCNVFENKRVQLNFTDSIIQAYEDKGIQIFMDGLSRGCENSCSFCKLNNNDILKKVNRSQIDTIKTIEFLRKKCQKKLFIQFTDENFFGGGKDRLSQIIELSKELANIHFDGILGIDTRLDTICNSMDENIHDIRSKAWDNLCNCGLQYCFLGLETFSSSQALRYNKDLNLSNFKYAISFLKKKV